MKIFLPVSDIFFLAKIKSKIEEQCNSPEDSDLIIADLEDENSSKTAKKYPEKTVCFCSHKEKALMNEFAAIGCKVYPRSVFFSRLHDILNSAVKL